MLLPAGDTAGRFAVIVIVIVIVGAQTVVNYVWLPVCLLWGILIIAIDVLVIWSVCTIRLDEV